MSLQLSPSNLPYFETERLHIRLLEPREARLMVNFRVANRAYLAPWEPSRSPEFFTSGFWDMQLRASLRDFRAGTQVNLALLNSAENEVVGVCNYTNIVRGTFQACHLGYAIGESYQGVGLMYEALNVVNAYIFDAMGLNRIMANYLPRNARSGRLLAKLGFVTEGRAARLLKIDGRWEDHILTAKVNPASSDARL